MIIMEIVPQHAEIHYRCAFDIVNDDRQMQETRRILRDWVKFKVSNGISEDAVKGLSSRKSGGMGWFFTARYNEKEADRFKFINGGKNCQLEWIQIRTALVGTNKEPTLWGMELIHPDSDLTGLYWATSVSLEYNSDEKTVRFVTAIRKYLRDYYIGVALRADEPSTPRFITEILNDLHCKSRDLKIYKNIRYITGEKYEEVPNLCKRLTNTQRQLPYILLVQPEDVSDELNKYKNKLSKLTRGNANIFALPRPAYEELSYYARDVKFYLPTLEKDAVPFVFCSLPGYDGLFHKWYYEINDQVLSEIICSVSRYSRGELRDLVSFQSVVTKQKVLEHSRLSEENEDLREFQKEYEKDNKELSQKERKMKETLATMKGENDRLWKALEVKEDNETALINKNKSLEFQIGELERSKQEVAKENRVIKRTNERIDALIGAYIESIEKQLRLCADIFNDRIVIHDKGIGSAKDYDKDYQNGKDFYKRSWQMLQELAITLYECYTSDDPKNIERRFNEKRKTPEVSFTMNEGRQTNKNSRLSREREINYKGKKVSIEPHLKMGSDKKALRLHLYFDNEEKKIIVGHWGKHMATAASGKGGERK